MLLAMLLVVLSGARIAAASAPEAEGPDAASDPEVAAGATTAPGATTDPPANAGPPGPPGMADGAPQWLDAVRAQREALQERRRAEHQAHRRALDPVGAARHEAMEQEFFRRRREMRDQMAEDRRWFLNFGPWMAPLPSPPGALPSAPRTTPLDAGSEPTQAQDAAPHPRLRRSREPPEWDNGWYFRGW